MTRRPPANRRPPQVRFIGDDEEDVSLETTWAEIGRSLLIVAGITTVGAGVAIGLVYGILKQAG